MKAPVSLSHEELLAVLAKAKERRLRDWVMLVTLLWHGLRVSELVSSSTRQLGLFFTRDRAERRRSELEGPAEIKEVDRKIKGKRRRCYLVLAPETITKPGLTFDGVEGQEITVQRLKGSLKTAQPLYEHEHPLLNEKLAWEEWLAERSSHGKKGGAKMQQNHILLHFANKDAVFGISRVHLWRLYRCYAREAGLPKRKQHPHCLKHTIGTWLIDMGLTLPEVQVHLGHKSIGSTGKYTLPREDVVSRNVGAAMRRSGELRNQQQGALFEAK
jgi:integrase